MSAPRRRRWIDVLRRAAEPASATETPADIDTALWSAHGEAQRAVTEAAEGAPRLMDAVTRQRASVEGVSERAGAMAAHAEGLTLAATRVADLFERLSVIALNAGLEGARTPEPQGKALLLVSEEIRTHAARGADATRDLVAVVEEMAAETSLLRGELTSVLMAADETGGSARTLGDAAVRAGVALVDVEKHLRRATGIDPEVARAVALAAEHARGLLSALSTLRATTPARPLLLGALRPVLTPLSRLLGELGDEGRAGEASPGSPQGDDGGASS
ncbi:hypothetical protein [Polyangium sorediatum]|uniref:Methyl-accepting transducer domain-containing protein n=1 Tax=Polyangium sorediatum TaxID=889274 RepID=A0ABT6NZ13_9BACT|nr:hypothetical protein [Polyangium sorediatum]MDI1433295.1 hypothetical protein [Polyangium sorediatum]